MALTIVCRDTINCKDTIVLCNGAQDQNLYGGELSSWGVVRIRHWSILTECCLFFHIISPAVHTKMLSNLIDLSSK